MGYRLLCAGVVLVLTGCFSEPPSGTGGGGSSTSSGGSTSTPDSTSSGGDAGSSTSEGASSSSGEQADSGSTGFDCRAELFEPGRVPPDVVVVIDEDVDLLAARIAVIVSQLESPSLGTNVAVLAPAPFIPMDWPFTPACDEGCGVCGDKNPTTILVPYTEGPVAALADAKSWNCMIRDAPSGTDVSGPTRHLWWITSDGTQELSEAFISGVRGGGFRLHATCPGCGDDNNNNPVSPSLANLVEETLGSYGDSNAAPLDDDGPESQAEFIARDRYSCTWVSNESPELVLMIPEGAADEDIILAGPVQNSTQCNEIKMTGFPGFYPQELNSGSGFAMCPVGCQLLQTYPAAQLEVAECLP